MITLNAKASTIPTSISSFIHQLLTMKLLSWGHRKLRQPSAQGHGQPDTFAYDITKGEALCRRDDKRRVRRVANGNLQPGQATFSQTLQECLEAEKAEEFDLKGLYGHIENGLLTIGTLGVPHVQDDAREESHPAREWENIEGFMETGLTAKRVQEQVLVLQNELEKAFFDITTSANDESDVSKIEPRRLKILDDGQGIGDHDGKECDINAQAKGANKVFPLRQFLETPFEHPSLVNSSKKQSHSMIGPLLRRETRDEDAKMQRMRWPISDNTKQMLSITPSSLLRAWFKHAKTADSDSREVRCQSKLHKFLRNFRKRNALGSPATRQMPEARLVEYVAAHAGTVSSWKDDYNSVDVHIRRQRYAAARPDTFPSNCTSVDPPEEFESFSHHDSSWLKSASEELWVLESGQGNEYWINTDDECLSLSLSLSLCLCLSFFLFLFLLVFSSKRPGVSNYYAWLISDLDAYNSYNLVHCKTCTTISLTGSFLHLLSSLDMLQMWCLSCEQIAGSTEVPQSVKCEVLSIYVFGPIRRCERALNIYATHPFVKAFFL